MLISHLFIFIFMVEKDIKFCRKYLQRFIWNIYIKKDQNPMKIIKYLESKL